MASRLGRLGSFLSEELVELLRFLDDTPAPRGAERYAALALRRWCADRWPHIGWTVREHGTGGASLTATHGPGPLLYSHLDTSLDRSARDAWITGRDDDIAPLRVSPGHVEGFGLGVARGAAAAALVAFAGAGRGTLLVAGSGTHRRDGGVTGVEAFLADDPVVPSAIVAKSGPRGVVWSEPGAAYLTVRVIGASGVVLAPASAVPAGGIVAHAGVVLTALSRWCEGYVSSRRPAQDVAASAGVGAIRSGWQDKPDLLPALLEIALYVGTIPGEDVPALAADVYAHVTAAVAGTPLAACTVSVTHEVVHAAAHTPPDAAIVVAAREAWTDELGAPPQQVTGWTGSTDGVVLRGHGIATARLGPSAERCADDPRRDRLDLTELAAFTRIYRRLLDTA